MAVNNSQSNVDNLNDGATDGKYRKRRPNTKVQPGMGDQKVQQNRAGLHPFWNYGYSNSEEINKVNPGA
jgi:hypothetical protein